MQKLYSIRTLPDHTIRWFEAIVETILNEIILNLVNTEFAIQ